MSIPKGRILGGSGSINKVAYNRGHRKLYDYWSTVYGLGNEWTYEKVLPYFIKSENNTDLALVAANPGYHGTNGPMEVSSSPEPEPIQLRWLSAVQQLGWPTVAPNGANFDINGAEQFGAGKFFVYICKIKFNFF